MSDEKLITLAHREDELLEAARRMVTAEKDLGHLGEGGRAGYTATVERARREVLRKSVSYAAALREAGEP